MHHFDVVLGGVASALWLLGLWYAAPLLSGSARSVAGRTRDAVIIGVFVPFALGLVHALYPLTCAVGLAALVVCRLVLQRKSSPLEPDRFSVLRYGPVIVTVVALAWPAAVRPLLEGDSLAYHLPNAAAWVHAHSLWTATTQYWWYPPASELFASGLYAVGGPFSIGLSGTVAVLLLGFRLAEWPDVPRFEWISGVVSAATIAVPMIALQTGSLENDVWLAAFFLESLWLLRSGANVAAVRTVATLALVKPLGILYALFAHGISARRPWTYAALAYVPFALWLAHDAGLSRGAALPPSAGATDLWATTILGQGLFGIVTFARAMLVYGGVVAGVLFVAAFVLASLYNDRRLLIAAIASTALYFVIPFAYATDVPQLDPGGHSLRFLIPTLAIGAIGVAFLGCRLPWTIGPAAIIAAAFGIYANASIFWNDATTHELAIVPIAFAVWLFFPGRLQNVLGIALIFVTIVWSNSLAQSHPIGYYNDSLRTGGETTRLFAWLAVNRPARLVVQDLRSGSVDIVSPGTIVQDASNVPCEQARSAKALLLLGPDSRYDPTRFAARKAAALKCGAVLYRDALSLVVRPAPT